MPDFKYFSLFLAANLSTQSSITITSKVPSDRSMHIFLSKQPMFKKADEIIERIGNLRKNKKVVEILREVVEEIV